MTVIDDVNFYKVIVAQIRKSWPEWVDWYLTLDPKKQFHLQKRMNTEMLGFIKVGMWEYAEFAAYRSNNRQTIEAKVKHDSPETLMALNAELKKKYNFDVLKEQ